MRFPDDYEYEMRGLTSSDRDIELLLSGSDPGNTELAVLVPAVAALRSYGRRIPSASAADRFAAEAAALVRSHESRADDLLIPTPRRRWALTPRLAGAAAAVLVVFATSGVAMAANGAIPGSALYGLDRALERAGIGAGGAEERLVEAQQLVTAGRPKAALEHLDEAFDQAEAEGEDVASLSGARHAVEDAAERLLDAEEAVTEPVVKDEVEALLRFIEDNVHKDIGVDGKEFAQRVAELARSIAGNQSQGDDESDTTSTTGNGGNGNGSENGGGGGNGNGGSNGNGGGNGPPEDSPSDTAPGQGRKP
jgi:uncharacterized membrane protein YgcG